MNEQARGPGDKDTEYGTGAYSDRLRVLMIGGGIQLLTLMAFRERLERGDAYERDEYGGCGCFAPTHQDRMDELVSEATVGGSR